MATGSLGRALTRLVEASLQQGVAALAAQDPGLARLADRNGVPPLWPRPPGFATLVRIVLEQQVSLESAAAAFANLEERLGTVEPRPFLEIGDAELKHIGFSRQKAGYCRGIATGLIEGRIDLDELEGLPDAAARQRLMEVRGIGPWTADVYLLFVMRRPDVWPVGDRALVVSMAEHLELDEVPEYDRAARIAQSWSPWRAVAARMLWHAYLVRRGRAL